MYHFLSFSGIPFPSLAPFPLPPVATAFRFCFPPYLSVGCVLPVGLPARRPALPTRRRPSRLPYRVGCFARRSAPDMPAASVSRSDASLSAVTFRFAFRSCVADVNISPLPVSIGRGEERGASVCQCRDNRANENITSGSPFVSELCIPRVSIFRTHYIYASAVLCIHQEEEPTAMPDGRGYRFRGFSK